MTWERQSEGTIRYEGPRQEIRWWINARGLGRVYAVGAEYEGPTRVHTRLCQHSRHTSLDGAWSCLLDLALELRREAKGEA